jgi:hypothetical protein
MAVLRTATISPLDEARHLVECLSSEFPTQGTSRAVQIAERNALASILTLHERFAERSFASVTGDWKSAADAVLSWVDAAGS